MKSTLPERLGMALQQRRRVHGLSQSQIAKLANLSLKYVGEIERGEANVSLQALERLCTALDWDPFEAYRREQDELPEGFRTLLLAELTHMQHLVQTAISWVRTLDAPVVPRVSEPATAPRGDFFKAAVAQLPPPLGRPRKKPSRQYDGPLSGEE